MAKETVRFEASEGIATVTLDRPDRLNAIDDALARDAAAALARAGADGAVRCVVLTGAGRAFCAGADLKQFEDPASAPSPGDVLRRRYHPLIETLVGLGKPTVAAVGGVAAGAGMSLALACDLRVAADDARFIQAFVRIGLVPDSGATYFLPRMVGWAKALELAMLGEPLDAQAALALGLVTRVVPAASLLEEARALARRLAAGPTRALAETRRALAYGARADLAAALDYEADLQAQLALSEDFREGVASFREKREARFTGR